jgi:CRISPR type III-A-associated RAMP protein Csm5
LSERILERYSLEITTLSPVHIGDGGRLTPLDYLEKDRLIHVINEDRLFEELERRRLISHFISYVERTRDASLKDFIERLMRDVGPRVYESMAKYSLEILSGRGEGKQILTFIRNAEGRAYIPGSEIKGAMRIALMHSILERDPAKISRVLGMLVSDPRNEDILLRPRIGEPHGDLGRLIRPSDSSPIDRVCVAQMYRTSTRLDSPIPLSLVEVVPENVAARASLTLVSSERIIREIGGPVSVQDIVDACMRKARRVIELEKRRIQKMIQGASRHPVWASLNEFYDNLLRELDRCRGLEAVLRIGGGQGLYSTTLISALINDNNFRRIIEAREAEAGRRLKEVRKLLSRGRPCNIKVVDINGRFMPLGWVRVVFREA